MDKTDLFEKASPAKALAVMAAPTIASQLVVLLYNLADTWFVGRTNNPYMIAASSLTTTIYFIVVALSNVFGVGGGSLMVRLIGEKSTKEARDVTSYSLFVCTAATFVFSLGVFVFMDPMLRMIGASDNTFLYAKQYVITTTVLGGIPTALSMCMPQLLRNCGYSKEAGFGVGLGSLLNVALDPLFMFVIFPKGYEVLGAGVATLLSNVISFLYFIIMFKKLQNDTVLTLPARLVKIEGKYKKSLYSVGIPAAVAIFLYDLVTMVINKLTVSYGDIALAAMGIVLKLERIPINTGLGICLGMVPLVAYNYGAKNYDRMRKISTLSQITVVVFAAICTILFWFFAYPIVSIFIADKATVVQGADILKGRCFALPFMMIGYQVVNFMNAVDKGKLSFLLAIIRHIVLIIPIAILMNSIMKLNGLIWSQLVADIINTAIAMTLFCVTVRKIDVKGRDENEA
ncbi:MAG: cation transporter [Lachnospiraceae bacterium]|nr:cation transporter [Lachnospiraceae bacterium]